MSVAPDAVLRNRADVGPSNGVLATVNWSASANRGVLINENVESERGRRISFSDGEPDRGLSRRYRVERRSLTMGASNAADKQTQRTII